MIERAGYPLHKAVQGCQSREKYAFGNHLKGYQKEKARLLNRAKYLI
jgi:hypothetical protein